MDWEIGAGAGWLEGEPGVELGRLESGGAARLPLRDALLQIELRGSAPDREALELGLWEGAAKAGVSALMARARGRSRALEGLEAARGAAAGDEGADGEGPEEGRRGLRAGDGRSGGVGGVSGRARAKRGQEGAGGVLGVLRGLRADRGEAQGGRAEDGGAGGAADGGEIGRAGEGRAAEPEKPGAVGEAGE